MSSLSFEAHCCWFPNRSSMDDARWSERVVLSLARRLFYLNHPVKLVKCVCEGFARLLGGGAF